MATGQVALDGLVALLDLERLERNLFRGVSPPHSPTRVFGGQVAGQALVAAGRTNREVAATLFLSPRTVEHHLRAAYRKLGVRSRTELAVRFAGGA